MSVNQSGAPIKKTEIERAKEVIPFIVSERNTYKGQKMDHYPPNAKIFTRLSMDRAKRVSDKIDGVFREWATETRDFLKECAAYWIMSNNFETDWWLEEVTKYAHRMQAGIDEKTKEEQKKKEKEYNEAQNYSKKIMSRLSVNMKHTNVMRNDAKKINIF